MGNAPTSIRLDGTHDRGMVDADRSIDLFEHHVPDVRIRALHALEEAVHGHGQDKGVAGIVASHLARIPGVIASGETDVCLVPGAQCLHESIKYLLIPLFVSQHDVGFHALGQIIADAGGHVQRIGKGDLLPTVMIGCDLEMVCDPQLKDLRAILLCQPQHRDRGAHRLHHGE